MRTLLMLAFWTLATPLAALVALPYTLITGSSDFLYRIAMAIVRGGLKLAGVEVEIRGRGQLDLASNYIFMANHVSDLDPPVLIPNLPRRTSVLVKKELFRIPVLGTAMRMAHLVPVDRRNRDAAIASVRRAADVIRGGLDMTIFPEGTRSPDGRLLPLKKGPFYLADEAGCGIVPVTILGTYQIRPKTRFFLRPGRATLIFHQPVWPRDYPDRDALMAAVRERIASALPEDRR
jgi:1-acyl-sn-glycerol-3-phosphate acyltransferase